MSPSNAPIKPTTRRGLMLTIAVRWYISHQNSNENNSNNLEGGSVCVSGGLLLAKEYVWLTCAVYCNPSLIL
jgi:hypothetical protein